MVGQNDEEHFRQIPAEYFDLIIVDECHRGSAKEDSNWRKVLEYFSSATQIGMQRITLKCTECSSENFRTEKNKKNTTDRLELNKFCPKCRKNTLHKETK